METPLRVKTLIYRSGDRVDTLDADVVVIVGPNNAGKTRTLQELQMLLHQNVGSQVGDLWALADVETETETDIERVNRWFEDHRFTYTTPGNAPGTRYYSTIGVGDTHTEAVRSRFSLTGAIRLGDLAPHFVKSFFAAERLQLIQTPMKKELGANPSHPYHLLADDQAKRQVISDALWSAFRQHLIVDDWGPNVRLRLSPRDVQADFSGPTETGAVPPDIERRILTLPFIDSQSEGVRSFTGIVLALLTLDFPVILIDEPEAFLHPPQARRLGHHLASLPSESQVFVATHSLDVLIGILEASAARVQVIRVTRDGDTCVAKALPHEQTRSLWRDPVLRFSRAFDGLFHKGVVVCEGPTDSQFYTAVMQHLAASSSDDADPISISPFDVMFVHAGSKQKVADVIRALRLVDVPVHAMVDFDVLRTESDVAQLLEALGSPDLGEWRSLLRLIDAHLRGHLSTRSVDDLRSDLDKIFGDRAAEPLTSSDVRAVERLAYLNAGWDEAKAKGRGGLPMGPSRDAADTLLATLRTAGLYVVPTGTVESFVDTVGSHGIPWVLKVIEDELIPDATAAQEFVRDALKSFDGGP